MKLCFWVSLFSFRSPVPYKMFSLTGTHATDKSRMINASIDEFLLALRRGYVRNEETVIFFGFRAFTDFVCILTSRITAQYLDHTIFQPKRLLSCSWSSNQANGRVLKASST